MATRRCFSAKVTEADPFKSLSICAQALYLHLGMAADDDGFLNNASTISRMMEGGAEALEELVRRRFVLQFGDVYVIKHWRISNSLKSDRCKDLNYPEIASRLYVKSNKAYTDHCVPDGKTLYEIRAGKTPPDSWNPNGIQMESKWNPNGILTEPNLTKPNLTKPNLTQPNLTEAAGAAGGWGQILSLYPVSKIGNEETAAEAYRANVFSTEDAQEMEDNLRLWLTSDQWAKEGGRYIPQLVNWITRGTWHTKPPKPKQEVPMGASGPGLEELESIWRTMCDTPEEFTARRDAFLVDHPEYLR